MRALFCAAMAIVLLIAPGIVRADLVSNGTFTNYTTGPNGVGNLTNYTTVTNWSTPANITEGQPNYNFLFIGGGNAASYYPTTSSYVELWGPIASPPAGGNYLGLDADANYSAAVSQTINGLTAGDEYTLTFNWAGAQFAPASGATTEQLQVAFGSQTQLTPVLNNVSQGFTGWEPQSMTFTAGAPSETLSFLAIGTPTGVSPVALLSDVSLNVPEPSSVALASLALVAIAKRPRRKTQ